MITRKYSKARLPKNSHSDDIIYSPFLYITNEISKSFIFIGFMMPNFATGDVERIYYIGISEYAYEKRDVDKDDISLFTLFALFSLVG